MMTIWSLYHHSREMASIVILAWHFGIAYSDDVMTLSDCYGVVTTLVGSLSWTSSRGSYHRTYGLCVCRLL